MIKGYPREVRDRARELFLEHPEMSYSDIAQTLYEEFGDVLERPPNKTTIRNWVKDLRRERYETEPVKEEAPTAKEKEKTADVKISEDVPPEMKELPKISPPEIAEKLAEKSVIVHEETPSAEELDQLVEGGDPQKEEGFMSKLKLPHGKIILILLGATVLGLLIYFLLKRRDSKEKKEEKPPISAEPEKREVVKKSPKVVEL